MGTMVVCLANRSHITQVSDCVCACVRACWRHTAIYISASGLGLKKCAKAVKSLSAILSALSSVLSDRTVFLAPCSPPSRLMQTQNPCSLEIQGRASRGPLKQVVGFSKVSVFIYFFPFCSERQVVIILIWSNAACHVDVFVLFASMIILKCNFNRKLCCQYFQAGQIHVLHYILLLTVKLPSNISNSSIYSGHSFVYWLYTLILWCLNQ